MAKKQKEEVAQTPTKFTRVYEHEDSTATWYFDLNKTQNGPVKVEIEYKKAFLDSLKKPKQKRTRKV
jgi:hypothetical protein